MWLTKNRLFENCIGIEFLVRFTENSAKAAWHFLSWPLRANDECDQAIKGAWWMSRRDEATKDAVGCDKPWGAVKRALIQGFPNGETRLRLISAVTGG